MDDNIIKQIAYLQETLNKLNEKYEYEPIKDWPNHKDKMLAYNLVHRLKQLRSVK